jgi:hypothetical protein
MYVFSKKGFAMKIQSIPFLFVIILCLSSCQMTHDTFSPSAPSTETIEPSMTPAKEKLIYFTRAGGDTLPLQPFQLTQIPDSVTPDPGGIQNANLTINDVEKHVGYTVLEPTWLPAVLSFVGANYDPNHKIAYLFYRYEDTNGLVLREEPSRITDDCELCGVIGASTKVEIAQIGGFPGEYVEGVWELTDSGSVWDPTPWLKTLRWKANDLAFQLLYMGPPESVSMKDMIAIAASIQ